MTTSATTTEDPAAMNGQFVPDRLLLGVCGSAAVLGLPTYLNAFQALGVARIDVILTPSAEKLLPASTVRLAAHAVHTEAEQGAGHIRLAQKAQEVLVLPASAHLLGCVASGLAPNLLTTTMLAVEKPIVLAPMMNPAMWRNKVVRRNVAQLREDGHIVIEPATGPVYEVAHHRTIDGPTLPSPQRIVELLAQQQGGMASS